MGIVNVTPDSFSDGGRFLDGSAAVAHGVELWDEGADWLDVGGESTRPGAPPVSLDDELARVLPVIEGLRAALPDAVLSIDTSKPQVAHAALQAGATVVNDVCAAEAPGMVGVLCAHDCSVVLMHKRGTPQTMQKNTSYGDLVEEVAGYLKGRAEVLIEAGFPADRILLDAGLGFGKDVLDNPRLIAATPQLAALGHPVLVGASRKRFVGALTGVEQPRDRVAGSIGAALAAARYGAAVLRVHDVAATIHALQVFWACIDAE